MSHKIFVVTLVIAVSVKKNAKCKVQSKLLAVRKEESCFETTISKVLESIERLEIGL